MVMGRKAHHVLFRRSIMRRYCAIVLIIIVAVIAYRHISLGTTHAGLTPTRGISYFSCRDDKEAAFAASKMVISAKVAIVNSNMLSVVPHKLWKGDINQVPTQLLLDKYTKFHEFSLGQDYTFILDNNTFKNDPRFISDSGKIRPYFTGLCHWFVPTESQLEEFPFLSEVKPRNLYAVH